MARLMGIPRPTRIVRALPLLRKHSTGPSEPDEGGRSVHRNDWVRSGPATAVRATLQRGLMTPLMKSQVRIHVHNVEALDRLGTAAVLVANHSSHLDAPVILEALGARRRRRVAIAAAADYFFDVWWRAAPSGLVIGTYPLERRGGRGPNPSSQLLADGWSLVIFAEGGAATRARCGPSRRGRPTSRSTPACPSSDRAARHLRGHAPEEELARQGPAGHPRHLRRTPPRSRGRTRRRLHHPHRGSRREAAREQLTPAPRVICVTNGPFRPLSAAGPGHGQVAGRCTPGR